MNAAGRIVMAGVLMAAVLGAPVVRAESESKTIQVSATILPRLELSITPETGSAIAFGALQQPAPEAVASRSVKVNVGVFSNLGHPYQVTQMVRRPLTNREGATIADSQFTVATREAALGSLAAPGGMAIVPGTSATLYTSNAIGKSDAFLADYTLTATSKTPAGDFGTEIVYTVTSL